MAWNIQDKGSADNDAQSVCFNTDLDVLSAGISGIDCVLFGLDFTGGADMTPDISKGAVLSNGVMFAVAAASVTHTTADATNPRFDLVVVTSAGALAVRAGTPAASPKPPARTANDVVIRRVYIGAGDTSVSTAQSTDMRVIRTQGPITIAKVTTPVTFNTTTANETYFSVTIPNGLFLTGRKLSFACGGTILNNSGVTRTFALTISYGGSTLYTDTSDSFGSDTDRRAWGLEFTLSATSATAQTLRGRMDVSESLTATTGTGDLATLAQQIAPIAGSSTVDSDAANRTLLVQMDMSASSADYEISMTSAHLDLR